MNLYQKIYVKVIANFNIDGSIYPLSLEWENGEIIVIDKIMDIKFTPPKNVGGFLTLRYKCLIKGQQRYLFFETKTFKWFVEKLI